jgi:hypothetical protein
MGNKGPALALFVVCLLGSLGVVSARSSARPKPDDTLRIDIPKKLDKANVVVDLGHLVFNGDAPFALGVTPQGSNFRAKDSRVFLFPTY